MIPHQLRRPLSPRHPAAGAFSTRLLDRLGAASGPADASSGQRSPAPPARARSAWWVATAGGQGRAGRPRSLLRTVGARRRHPAAMPPASGGADDSLHERKPQAAGLPLPLARRADRALLPNPPAPLPPPG